MMEAKERSRERNACLKKEAVGLVHKHPSIYTVCELCNDPHRKAYFYAPSLRVKVTPLNRYASILRFLFCFFFFSVV